MRRTTTLLFCVVLALCALTASADEHAVFSKNAPRIEAHSEMASVFLVRPSWMGKQDLMWAFADDKPIGVTKGKTYAHAEIEPGTYIFWSVAENVHATPYTVEAGKTYYLKLKIVTGTFAAAAQPEFLSEANGQDALKKCKSYSTLTDEGRTFAATNFVTNLFEKVKEESAKGNHEVGRLVKLLNMVGPS